VNQIVSGALTFALAAGCPVVSTPYRYAQDVLADGAGTLVDFGDAVGFAEALLTLLVAGPERETALLGAKAVSASMSWPMVGKTMLAVLMDASLRKVKPVLAMELPDARRARPTSSIRSSPRRHRDTAARLPQGAESGGGQFRG
jgi:hypothetical protein